MTDKDNEGEDEKAKKSGLNNSVLGGFARTSAKRFAEYKYTAKENEARNTGVATAAPSNRHSRREWLERLFDLFEQYAVEVNKLVDEAHLVTTCLRPTDKPATNPLVSPSQGVVSTKYWQLTVRLQADGIAGYLLPVSMEKTFLRDESLFERIFLIESQGEDAAVWSFDNKPTEFFQLPDLAKRFFGSLIEIAQVEDISNIDTSAENAIAAPEGSNESLVAAPGENGDDSTFDDEAMFKDLLNFGSNVAPSATPDVVPSAEAVEESVTSSSPFASLSAEPIIDLAKLEEQAETVRKKNKSSSSDLATKTLDSYALLDFEDADTYYNEYRLTPAPEQTEIRAVEIREPAASNAESQSSLSSSHSAASTAAPQPIADYSKFLPPKPATPMPPIQALSSSMQNMPAQPASPSHAMSSSMQNMPAQPVPVAEAATEHLLQEQAPESVQTDVQQAPGHTEELAEAAAPPEADHDSNISAVSETDSNSNADSKAQDLHADAVSWESGSPASWQQDLQSEPGTAAAKAEAAAWATNSADHMPISFVASITAEPAELPELPTPTISAVPPMPPSASYQDLTPVVPPPSLENIAPPVITPVTRPSADASAPSPQAKEPLEPAAPIVTAVPAAQQADAANAFETETNSNPPETAPHAVPTHLKTHAYRSNDLDLLTPADVDITPPTVDEERDDSAIAEALLAVTQPSQQPEIKESLTRNELSSEVQKLAAKLQQTASDLIGTFNRKAEELASATDSQENPILASEVPFKITPVTPMPPEPPSHSSENSVTEQQSVEHSFDQSTTAPASEVETVGALKAVETVEAHSAQPEAQTAEPQMEEAAPEVHANTSEAQNIEPEAHVYTTDAPAEAPAEAAAPAAAAVQEPESIAASEAESVAANVTAVSTEAPEALTEEATVAAESEIAVSEQAESEQTEPQNISAEKAAVKIEEPATHAATAEAAEHLEQPVATPELRSEDDIDFDEFEQAMQTSLSEAASPEQLTAGHPTGYRTPSGNWKVFSADEVSEDLNSMDLISGLEPLTPIPDDTLDRLTAAKGTEQRELAAEQEAEQVMQTESAETEEIVTAQLAPEPIYEAQAEALEIEPVVDAHVVEEATQSTTQPGAEPAAQVVELAEVPPSEPAAVSEPAEVVVVVEAEEVVEVPTAQGSLEAEADTTANAAAPDVAAPESSSDYTTVESDSEKTAFSDKFRRSNQITSSKKFQPYSSTASEPAAEIKSETGTETETEATSESEPPKTFFESLQSISVRRSQSQAAIQDNTQPQENTMPKTDEMSVIAAIEMMRHSVDRELMNVAESGARAFQDQDMDAVERAMKRTRRVQEFKDQLLPALAAWDKLGKED